MFNSIVHQYLIPGAQIGVKVAVEPSTKEIGDIFTASRVILPYSGAGCLECNHLISADRLRLEALPEPDRRAQRYVEDDEVQEPSVIALNALSAAQVAVDFMLMFTGLFKDGVTTGHVLNFVRERTSAKVSSTMTENCPDCGVGTNSRRARGDRFRLPYRETKAT